MLKLAFPVKEMIKKKKGKDRVISTWVIHFLSHIGKDITIRYRAIFINWISYTYLHIERSVMVLFYMGIKLLWFKLNGKRFNLR